MVAGELQYRYTLQYKCNKSLIFKVTQVKRILTSHVRIHTCTDITLGIHELTSYEMLVYNGKNATKRQKIRDYKAPTPLAYRRLN